MWTAVLCLSLPLIGFDKASPDMRPTPPQPAQNSDAASTAIAVLRNSHRVPPDFVQAARKKLALQTADALPGIVLAMHDCPTSVFNSLRSCGDAIVVRALNERRDFPRDELLRLAADHGLSGPARRIALAWRERADPGFSVQFLRDRLDDPEFSADAVEATLREADFYLRKKDVVEARVLLRNAFVRTIEVEHAQRVADRLRATGESVDLHRHLGTVTDWYVIGPFSGTDGAGATTAFSPESGIDFNASYPGKSTNISWKKVRLSASHTLIDLRKLLGEAEDAVAYLAAQVTSDEEHDVELRGVAGDGFQAWLNGKTVIDSTKGDPARLDKIRAKVTLQEGTNTILLKVCHAGRLPNRPLGSPPRWQAGLRIVDRSGHGLPLPSAE